jgi:hypothetical protein
VRALRNFAAIAVALLAIASCATLAVASHRGHARSDSSQGQYGTKPDCRPYVAKKHHYGWAKYRQHPRECPKPGRRHHSRR